MTDLANETSWRHNFIKNHALSGSLKGILIQASFTSGLICEIKEASSKESTWMEHGLTQSKG